MAAPPPHIQANANKGKGIEGWKIFVGIGAVVSALIIVALLFGKSSDPDKITIKVVCNGCEASYHKNDEEPVTKYNVKEVWEKGIWCERGGSVAVAAKNVRTADKIAVYIYLNGDLVDSDNSSGEGSLVAAFGYVPNN